MGFTGAVVSPNVRTRASAELLTQSSISQSLLSAAAVMLFIVVALTSMSRGQLVARQRGQSAVIVVDVTRAASPL